MSSESPINDPWKLATFDGNEREQLQRWAKLSFEEKLEWLEEGHKLSKALQESRAEQGGAVPVR